MMTEDWWSVSFSLPLGGIKATRSPIDKLGADWVHQQHNDDHAVCEVLQGS